MRIFFVTNNYTPYSGGVVQSITAITDELRKQGHEVFIITLNFLDVGHHDPEYVIRIACPIKFKYKKNYMAIPWRPTHAIHKLIMQYKPDIIHVQHPFLLGVSALYAARKHSIPCIFTYHTMYEEYAHYIPFVSTFIRPLIRSMVLQFCNSVDAIIAPSNYIKQYLQAHNIQTPISVIPSPLRKMFYDTASRARRYPSTGSGRAQTVHNFTLLLVTRFTPEKNIPFVFEVMKLLPEKFHLTLVGYGVDYKKMQNLAYDTFRFSPTCIRFIHQPPQDDLLRLYQTSDIFIFPSQTDTQGIVLAESMSQGLPVIALDGPGQRDIIVNGYNGFIIENAQQAAEHIMKISKNGALRAQLKKGAHTTAQHYRADSIVKQLVQLYMSMP